MTSWLNLLLAVLPAVVFALSWIILLDKKIVLSKWDQKVVLGAKIRDGWAFMGGFLLSMWSVQIGANALLRVYPDLGPTAYLAYLIEAVPVLVGIMIGTLIGVREHRPP